ncbi:MAG: hypothetical protein RTU30_02815 [Candidatus Thorarchaeota archaeon]
MDSLIIVTLREILCASLSLDDGLSAIQNISIARSDESNVVFEVARAIEEVLLRRPSLATAKLTELVVRLSFEKDHTLSEMLMLLDTRFTNSHRRAETELLPDIDAIPQLLDILGELSQAISSALKLNLRPLLPFLTDEILMSLNAITDRGHEGSTTLALHEIHYLTGILIEAGFYEGAELLLNRLMTISRVLDIDDFTFEVSMDYASVLTELGLYEESRQLLTKLEDEASYHVESASPAAVKLLLAVNQTRDDAVPHEQARETSDEVIRLFEMAVKSEFARMEDLGVAKLVIGSNILAVGWREGVSQAVKRLESSLETFDSFEESTLEHSSHLYKCLSGLGFAHGLMGDHENITRSIEYLDRAKSILHELESNGHTSKDELARVENALGWVCLSTDSNEYWSVGITAFETAIQIRNKLVKAGAISQLELLGSQLGLMLSLLRSTENPGSKIHEPLRETVAQYIPLFPIDPRAFVEVAIAIYNVVWVSYRHGHELPPRILRLLDDIDSMLDDAQVVDTSGFVEGVSLVVPYLSSSWSILSNRAERIISRESVLTDVARLMSALATSKLNIEALGLEAGVKVLSPIDDAVTETDPLLAQYWDGQTLMAETIKAFYENKDYSNLASGLYAASLSLGKVASIDSDFYESVEFVKATAASLASVLLRFAKVLEDHYAAEIDRTQHASIPVDDSDSRFDFILSEDWLGLTRITEAYLQMVEQSEMVQAQPYLNAVFSNISRAMRMMDSVAMVDRRVLAFLGNEMNRRYYLRS